MNILISHYTVPLSLSLSLSLSPCSHHIDDEIITQPPILINKADVRLTEFDPQLVSN